MRAEKVVASLLNGAGAVTAIVGTKITAVLAEQPSDAPFVVYWKESAERQPSISIGGPIVVSAIISVQVVALDYTTLKNLGEAVRVALLTTHGNIAGVDVNDIQVAAEGPDFFDPELQLYAQLWQYLVTHQE